MSNLSFTLVAEASNRVGLGHLRRSVSFGIALKSLGFRVEAFSALLDDGLVKEYTAADIPVLHELRTEAPNKNNFVIVDGYNIDLARFSKKDYLIIFEDYVHRPLECRILIDSNVAMNSLSQSGQLSFQTLLEGPEYIALSPEYDSTARARQFKRRPALLISIGGSDPGNTTRKVLIAALEMKKSFSRIGVVLGPLYAQADKLRNEFAQEKIVWLDSPNSLFDIYENFDVAIGAAGRSAYERVSRNMPSISLITAANQVRVAQGLHAEGLSAMLDARVDSDIQSDCLSYLLSEELTERVRTLGHTRINGQGSELLARKITSEILASGRT